MGGGVEVVRVEEKRRSVEAVWVRISRCGLAVMEGSHGAHHAVRGDGRHFQSLV